MSLSKLLINFHAMFWLKAFLIIVSLACSCINKSIALSDDEMPDEFMELADSFQSQISLYYRGKLLGDFEADYNNSTLTFTDPQKIINALKAVKDQSVLEKALSQALPTNEDLICTDKPTIPVCHKPETKIVSVVFNPDWFRADLFIHHNYISAEPPKYLIDRSEGNLSWINGFNFVTSGVTNNPELNIYTLTNTGALSHGMTNLNYQFVIRASEYGSENENITRNFQNLDLSYYYHRYRFNVGFLNSRGNYFIANQYFLGIQAQTDQNLLDTKYLSRYGSKLELFLDEPSQVILLYNGTIVSVANYDAGLQNIDTSSLPQGAYNLTLRITDYLGKTTEVERFFVEYPVLPLPDFPEYYFNLGYITNTNSSESILPTVTKDMMLNFGANQRISDYWGLNSSFLQLGRFSYFDAGVYTQHADLYIEPSVLIGFQNDYGLALGINYLYNQYLNFNLTFRSLWGTSKQEPEEINYDQFLTSTHSLSASTSFNYDKWRTSLSAQLSQNEGSKMNYALSGGARYNLYQSDSTKITVGTSLNKSRNNYGAHLSITLSLNTFGWDISNQTNMLYSQANKSGYNAEFSASHEFSDGDYANNIRLSTTKSTDSSNAASQINYSNDYIMSQGALNYTPDNGTQFSAALSTTVAMAISPFNFDFANLPQIVPPFSGVLVKAEGDENMKMAVYNDQRHIGTLSSSNSSALLPLRPFQKHNISLRSVSDTAYVFNEGSYQNMYYPGNVRSYVWELSTLLTVIMQIHSPTGQPLDGLSFKYNDAIYESDPEGGILVEYPANYTHLTLEKDQPYCKITLPNDDYSDRSIPIDLGTQVCHPINET